MSLYPSLEDMKVDKIQQAQIHASQPQVHQQPPQFGYPSVQTTPYPPQDPDISSFYPSLNDEYMGLRLQPPSGPIPEPQPKSQAVVPSGGYAVAVPAGQSGKQMVAPISGGDVGLARANVTHGVREIILCKDDKGKIGLRLRAVDKGVFAQFVMGKSAAALAGIRFGDQILQINGENVAGFSADKAMNVLKKEKGNKISVAVRDRPFERTITLHKDSSSHVGFTYKDNKITNIAKDTSAARNGLLIEHHILEVNGQNVVGIKNKELGEVFDKSGAVVTLTIMPSYIYEHMVKCMSDGLLKKKMDHSIPDYY